MSFRTLLIETPSYQNDNYIKIKDFYQENIKELHKLYLKLKTIRKKELEFKFKIIGFNKKESKYFDKINSSTLKNIKSEINKINDKVPDKVLNLSLFSDYDKSTTTPGLGFKDKEKALYTIEKIKDREIKYQISVITTMLGRAKNHPNQTEGMREAIKVFEKWLEKYKQKKEKNN